jgi:DNA recombination protein RmuC
MNLIKPVSCDQHVDSMRNHIKGLSDKGYQAAGVFDTPDFVLLFLPIESAFSAALQNDPELVFLCLGTQNCDG